jgi:hypothetical protein
LPTTPRAGVLLRVKTSQSHPSYWLSSFAAVFIVATLWVMPETAHGQVLLISNRNDNTIGTYENMTPPQVLRSTLRSSLG